MKGYNMHLSFLLLGVRVVTPQKTLMQEGSLKYHKGHLLSHSKIITPELIGSFAFICNGKYLINKLNILQVHKNYDNI